MLPERLQNPAGQTRLAKHFEEQDIKEYTRGWSNLWDAGNSDLWDRGKPSPALIDLIEERGKDLFNPIVTDGKRKKALVPGCGKGYDVVMLALHGYDAYGLEVSETGVSVARKYAQDELGNPQSYNFGPLFTHDKDQNQTRGQVEFLHGDFFKSDWEIDVRFDLIYDYTFLCALHPSMRPQWASRMASLLNPVDGKLVCLEFPMYKDPKLPGPPWGLNGVHWNLLATGGDGVVDGNGGEEEADLKGLFEREIYFKPARSYESGKGTDMVSVYSRKL